MFSHVAVKDHGGGVSNAYRYSEYQPHMYMLVGCPMPSTFSMFEVYNCCCNWGWADATSLTNP
jgi:hypothetical protein